MASTDEQIGRNLVRLRGDISQKDLADKMRDFGWKWSQATVWSIEKGERPLRLTEAIDLAGILAVSMDALIGDDDVVDDMYRANAYQNQARRAQVETRTALDLQLDIATSAAPRERDMPRSSYWMEILSPAAILEEELLRVLTAGRNSKTGGPLAVELMTRWATQYKLLAGLDWQQMRPEASNGEHPEAP